MAGITSLGLHVPSGVNYLVEEKILPEDPPATSFTWQIFDDPDEPNVADELVCAASHVIWSRGDRVHRVFSFDVEKEVVQQALFTSFPRKENEQDTANNPSPGTLNIKKRDTRNKYISLKAELDSQTWGNPSRQKCRRPNGQRDRALVVVLETQFQIFFLSGMHSIVPISFEIDRVFALSEGLIVQRRSFHAPKPQLSHLTPKTPLNSFAFSQSFTQTPEALRMPPNATNPDNEPKSIKAMFNSALTDHEVRVRANVPSHYHLSDPFSEFGVLGQADVRSKVEKGFTTTDEIFSQSEQLLYTSTKSEVSTQHVPELSSDLLFAVSVNVEKRQLNVWQITKPQANTYWKHRQRIPSYETERKRRRRSSQPGTGAATPNPRHSIGPRESFAGTQESFAPRDQLKDDEDLAAQLDPAFQNPRAPGPSKRRISSMLARSDLTGMDMFSDGNIGSVSTQGLRRGPSMGSAGGTTRSFRQTSDQHHGLRNSMRSDNGPPVTDGTSEEESFKPSPSQDFAMIVSSSKGLRVGVQMRLLHSVNVDASTSHDFGVFIVPSTQVSGRAFKFLLCVVSRIGGELLLYRVDAELERSTTSTTYSWISRVTDLKRAENVVDACAFVDEDEVYLTVLSRLNNNEAELSLRSVESAPLRFRIPNRLLINFPYILQFSSRPPTKNTTGSKHLIDMSASANLALQRGSNTNQIIIAEKSANSHRLHIGVEPKNRLVRKCLEICEIASRGKSKDRKLFLFGWWEAYRYLQQRNESLAEIEWKAFLVLLLTICRPNCETERTNTPVRTTRRKGGFLRSSSGASTDLSDFHDVIMRESSPVSARPLWMGNSAWSWAMDEHQTSSTAQAYGLGISPKSKISEADQTFKKNSLMIECIAYGQELNEKGNFKTTVDNIYQQLGLELPGEGHISSVPVSKLLAGLHLYREELKLDLLTEPQARQMLPLLAQLGGWLGWISWSWENSSTYMTEDLDLRLFCFDERPVHPDKRLEQPALPSILSYVAQVKETEDKSSFPSLKDLCKVEDAVEKDFMNEIPRIRQVEKLMKLVGQPKLDYLKYIRQNQITYSVVETLPEGIAAPLRSCISLSQSQPDSGSTNEILGLLDRDDLGMLARPDQEVQPSSKASQPVPTHTSLRDQHAICRSTGDDESTHTSKTDASTEIDRAAVTRMIFKDDQRVKEAQRLLHPLEPPVVRCNREPDWSEQEFLEAEQELAKVVAIRTLSVCAGRGLLIYGGRSPLLTERFPTHGFTLSCVMKPSNNTVTAEKEVFTEEKVSWAFFHAGAEAGLSISKASKGIDTSWIVFNKPQELNNRHAGFLLALGLNGHLKNIAKWVAFKYLTPKHTMTSIGLLLGLAASYLGTMDTLIVRLLSVHVTRMLPPGAAELNLSPLTQTTGILALGLLYCETQHRRMSEIMLSEMENTDQEENDYPLDTLRDEGYRLAAGFALGFINLGQGKNLRGLHDMHLVERLLALAVSTKRVDLVHVLDKASAAAAIAIALIFMKSDDEALAKKIDIPDTTQQFDYVRPDLFLIRTVAHHMIMWNKIQPTEEWMLKQLPSVFRKTDSLDDTSSLDVKDLPLYNTIAGLCFALGLRYAGTANQEARDILVLRLDQFIRLARLPALNFDHRLTRTTLRNCQDTVALAASCVMAGTGDVKVLRRLRSLHGRTDPETPYGSHMAVHQAIGTLFLAGGTHTFKSTNLAIAALFCAFYPLFPTSVLDNKGHLQAFRHLWVLAAEPRCLVVRSVDSHRPISMLISLRLTDGSEMAANAPCLLPSIHRISSITLNDPRYWRVVLDLGGNAAHRAAFARHQSMFARRKGAGAHEAGASAFSTAVRASADEDAAVTATASGPARQQDSSVASSLDWVFQLPSFKNLSAADRSLALPPEVPLANRAGSKISPVDDRLMLRLALDSTRADRLWSLRILFAWADLVARKGEKKQEERERMEKGEGQEEEEQMGWLEKEVVSGLKAELGAKIAQMDGA